MDAQGYFIVSAKTSLGCTTEAESEPMEMVGVAIILFFVFDAHYKRAQPGKCKGAKRRSEPLLFSGGVRIMRQTKTKSVIDKEKNGCRHLIMSVILLRQESAAV